MSPRVAMSEKAAMSASRCQQGVGAVLPGGDAGNFGEREGKGTGRKARREAATV